MKSDDNSHLKEISHKVRNCIRRFDYNALSSISIDALSDLDLEKLIAYADRAAARNIQKTASCLTSTRSSRIPLTVYHHSERMLNYLAIRASLCGQGTDAIPDLEVY
jgi:hypothetical protein